MSFDPVEICAVLAETAPHTPIVGMHRELGVFELDRLGELRLPEGYRRTIERWASAARTPPV